MPSVFNHKEHELADSVEIANNNNDNNIYLKSSIQTSLTERFQYIFWVQETIRISSRLTLSLHINHLL